jgi:cysteine-rich repeat protein
VVRFCGDGVVDANDGEACDDQNNNPNDGCDATCAVEEGYVCDGEPSVCNTVCGDSITAGDEACDDGPPNTEACDYGLTSCVVCDDTCQNAAGAVRFCGDGVVDANDGEACDDQNNNPNDGCDATCVIEEGYVCNGEPSVCSTVCGDDIQVGAEECDDGNDITDECAYNAQSCEVCRADCTLGDGITQYCGDGSLNGPEICDQGADNGEPDCQYDVRPCQVCNPSCELEQGVEIYCGDGVVQPEFEDCDGSRGCSNTCTLPCSPNCPPIEMIDIPAGSFTMGSNFFSVSAPQHTVTFASGFQISKSEITADHYQLCVDAEYCSSSGTGADCNSVAGGKGDHPQNCITRV